MSKRYTAEQLRSFPWIVSTDTLRPDHLAQAFLSALDSFELPPAERLCEPFRSDLVQLASHAGETVASYEMSDSYSWALENAESLLQELAPAGFYFGASEGDGASFGFWLSEDWREALEDRGIDCEEPSQAAQLVQELEDHGIDADNLCDAYQGQTEGCTEERAGANFAQELAEDCGDIDWQKLRWPLTCIDWDAAWHELEVGDGFALIPASGVGSYHVIRSV